MLFFRRKKQNGDAQAEQSKKQDSAAMQNINPIITSIKLTGKQLKVEVTVDSFVQKDLSSIRLVLKNMLDSSDTHSFSPSDTMDSVICFSIWLDSVPFIRKEGKWSLYVKDEEAEYRLSPSRDSLHNITETKKNRAEGMVTEAYVTVKENVSIRTIKDPNEKAFVESRISDVQFTDGILHLTGSINQHRINMTGTELLLQKRDTELEHRFPLEWAGYNSWSAAIDFNSGEFKKGTWDYYLLYDQGRPIRIKTGKTIYQDDEIPTAFYKDKQETVSVTYYTTIKGSFSTKHGAPVVRIIELAGVVTERNHVKLSGILPSIFPPEKLENPSLILMDDNSVTYEARVHFDSEKHSAGKRNIRNAFDVLIPYDECMKPKKKKLDAYLQFDMNGRDYLFRLQTDAHSIARTSQVSYQDPELWQVYFYSTINENLALATSRPKLIRDVSECSLKHDLLVISGYTSFEAVDIPNTDALERKVVIRKRNTGEEISVPVKAAPSAITDDMSGFKTEIRLEDILSMHESLNEIYGLSIQVTYKGYTHEKGLRCEDFTYIVDAPLDRTVTWQQNNTYFSYLLFTPSGSLKLETYCYSIEKADFILNGHHMEKSNGDIWLIGERPETAQDTGFHFFNYVRKNYPNIEAYYVIEEDSPDLENIRELENIVYFGSMEHLTLTASATTFIGSHDLEYLLPTKSVDWSSYQKGKRVFLQHGVLGRKRVDYFKNQYRYPFNMFCVSSEAEFKLVTETMGYDADEVKITGLSRFDQLDSSSAEENIIAIVPTWRDWLGTEEQFLASDYYQRYKQLLTDQVLLNKLSAAGAKIQFFPHYRMQHYINHFARLESDHVEVIEFGQINIQQTLKDCSMLITDYSSLSFDINFMQKPVVFYHFDFAQFFKKGILQPKEETFLGDICTTNEQVVSKVCHYLDNAFREDQELQRRINESFAYHDKQHNKRIFDAVMNLPK